MADGTTLAFILLTLAIDFVLEALWGNLNSHTSYLGWSIAVVLAYQHLIPLGISTGAASAIIGRGD
jgi:hypothetical protein